MFKNLSNKELVTVTHDLGKTLSADTPLIDIAKLLAESATRLDVATVRGNELQKQLDAVVAENAMLKSNLMYWDADNPESPYGSPLEIACECSLIYGEEFEVQVAARMPNLTYRVSAIYEHRTEVELVSGALPETPATDAILNEVRAECVASLWRDSLRDVGRVLSEIGAYHDASEAGGNVHDEIKERVDDYIAKLRADAAKDGE